MDSRNQWGLPNRLHPGDVERWMDPQGPAQFEPHHCRIDDLQDLERSNEPGSQFLTFYPQGKVSGRKPYPLASLVTGGFRAAPVGCRGITVDQAKKRSSGLSPGTAAAADKSLDRGAGNLLLQGRKQWRLEPVGTLERGHPSGRAGQGVVGILHPQELLGPRRQMLGDQAP